MAATPNTAKKADKPKDDKHNAGVVNLGERRRERKKRTEPDLSRLGYNGRDTPEGKRWCDRRGWVPA